MNRFCLAAFTTTIGLVNIGYAGSIQFDTRLDYESGTFNSAANKSNYNKINFHTLRVDFKGNVTEDLNYVVRFRMNRPDVTSVNTTTGVPANNQRDSLSEAIALAYLHQKLIDHLSVQLGKICTDIGGIEGITPAPLLYLTSQAYADQNNLRFVTGGKLIYEKDNHEIDFMVLNQETDAVNTTYAQTRQAWGAVYKGIFMDKALAAVASWHIADSQSTSALGRDLMNNYYSIGGKYEMPLLFVELDYLYNTLKNKSVQGETDETTSTVLTLGKRMENWTGKLKFENSEAKVFTGVSTSGKDKYQGYQMVVEYVPTKNKNMNYHLAFVGRNQNPGAAGDEKRNQYVYLGFRLLAEILK